MTSPAPKFSTDDDPAECRAIVRGDDIKADQVGKIEVVAGRCRQR